MNGRLRIGVVGSGIAGLATAYRLGDRHDVTLFEAAPRLGGHTHTHDIACDGRRWQVDTGFIVFNPGNYPLLSSLFAELGVESRPTTMSFSVHNAGSGLEYNAGSLDGLFCQRRNLRSARFWRLLMDLRRFYREAPQLLEAAEPGPVLGDYLEAGGYSAAFRDDHLIPMASALWSSPAATSLQFPVQYLVRFMANHHLLRLTGRPAWRVVAGGSSRYIDALQRAWSVRVRLDCPVRRVLRLGDRVQVDSAHGRESFDHLVLACHSDQALALLADPSEAEARILGAMPYQDNDTVLHTDARLMPRHPKAWAAWNAYVPSDPQASCTVSYCMNLLQSLPGPTPFIVTLNRTADIDPSRILARAQYAHPVYTPASVAARARKGEIQGQRRTWYAGAYWGWGFHEDGMRSAQDVVDGLTAVAASRQVSPQARAA